MNILDHFDHQGKKLDKDHFRHLIQVALADGKIDQSEKEMLHLFGMKVGLTNPEINQLIDATTNSGYSPPYELYKRFGQVYDTVKMILADGVIDKNEMRLATIFAEKSGFTDSEIPMLLVTLIRGIKEGTDEEDLFEAYKKLRKS